MSNYYQQRLALDVVGVALDVAGVLREDRSAPAAVASYPGNAARYPLHAAAHDGRLGDLAGPGHEVNPFIHACCARCCWKL